MLNNQPHLDGVLDTSTPKKRGFHPKRFLKNAQQRLHTSPYLYLLFCFLVPVAVMYIIYIVKGIYPFYDGTPLVLDLNAQYVYFFEALRNAVYGEGSLLYSFSRSLGGEFMGMYAYYMASPLTYIVALFPQDRIQEAVLTILLLKTGLCGLSFGYYLHRRSKNPRKLVILSFSVLYALSAYAVVQQSNTMWIDALIWLPIFTFALEELITNRKYKLYVISLVSILVSNYYIGYMVCIFAVLYFFYHYFSKSQEEINPRKERLHFVRAGARFGAFSILSAAISAFMLFAAYYSLGFGKSEFSKPNWSIKANFDILDFLTKFLPGSYDTFEPSGLPFVYCGLLVLFMVPVYFLAKKISTREKVASAILLSVFFVSFIVKPIDLIWHGFSTPNWLNGRYSFLFCFVLLVLAYKGFNNLKKVGDKAILAIGAFIVLFIAVAEKFELVSFINSKEQLLTFGCIWFSVAFTVALAVILCVWIKAKTEHTLISVSAVLAALISIEVLCNGIVCVMQIHEDVRYTSYSNYQDFMTNIRPAVEAVKEYDKGFYRMEKLHHRKYNDNAALGIRGLSNSTSTLNSSAIQLVNYMGYTGRAHLTQYNGGTPISDSLLGIKYVIDHASSEKLTNVYDEVDEIENELYTVYRNPYALSLAYGVDKDISKLEIKYYDTFFDRLNGMVTAMLADEEVIRIFKPISDMKTQCIDCEEVLLGYSTKYSTPADREGTVTFSYVADYTGNYYFYSPVSSATETYIQINYGTSVKYLGNDSNHIVYAGYFEQGDTIDVTITLPEDCQMNFRTGIDFLWHLDGELYEECFERLLANPQLDIDESSTDDHITGSISTSNEDQMILTTIPFDEGWKVFVDGRQVEIYETLDALMAFDIEESGDHTVELKYSPDIYKTGIALSISATVVFIVLCAAEFVLKRTFFKDLLRKDISQEWILEDLKNDMVADISEIDENLKGNGDTAAELEASDSQTDLPEIDEDNSSKTDTDNS